MHRWGPMQFKPAVFQGSTVLKSTCSSPVYKLLIWVAVLLFTFPSSFLSNFSSHVWVSGNMVEKVGLSLNCRAHSELCAPFLPKEFLAFSYFTLNSQLNLSLWNFLRKKFICFFKHAFVWEVPLRVTFTFCFSFAWNMLPLVMEK